MLSQRPASSWQMSSNIILNEKSNSVASLETLVFLSHHKDKKKQEKKRQKSALQPIYMKFQSTYYIFSTAIRRWLELFCCKSVRAFLLLFPFGLIWNPRDVFPFLPRTDDDSDVRSFVRSYVRLGNFKLQNVSPLPSPFLNLVLMQIKYFKIQTKVILETIAVCRCSYKNWNFFGGGIESRRRVTRCTRWPIPNVLSQGITPPFEQKRLNMAITCVPSSSFLASLEDCWW